MSDALSPLTVSLGRYAAAVGAFCTLMAVLGAKRPQDRGWQWVVLSLWIIMLVPAMQAVAARSGQQLELFGAWRLLIWGLVAMGLLNFLPTRFALPAIIASVGQTLLLSPYLLEGTHVERWRALGPVGLFVAALTALLMARMRRPADGGNDERVDPLRTFNDRWLRFRDGWGAFWGLRILQRVNQTAELSEWPVRLEWSRGFVGAASEDAAPFIATLDEQTIAHIEQTLDSLLRRFERLESA
jgi:hypothetical protein